MSYWIKPSMPCLIEKASSGTLISAEACFFKRKRNIFLSHQLVENCRTDSFQDSKNLLFCFGIILQTIRSVHLSLDIRR